MPTYYKRIWWWWWYSIHLPQRGRRLSGDWLHTEMVYHPSRNPAVHGRKSNLQLNLSDAMTTTPPSHHIIHSMQLMHSDMALFCYFERTVFCVHRETRRHHSQHAWSSDVQSGSRVQSRHTNNVLRGPKSIRSGYLRWATCVITGQYATSNCKLLLVMFM